MKIALFSCIINSTNLPRKENSFLLEIKNLTKVYRSKTGDEVKALDNVSISYKKREIGILRAVGAKSSDVFKIFFSEALVIALLNFILSLATVIGAVTFANTYMRSQGINITLLTFGVRQVVLMLLISIVVALVASFLPVWNIARRKPIDAIKNK